MSQISQGISLNCQKKVSKSHVGHVCPHHFSVPTVRNRPPLESQTCNVTPLGGSEGRCSLALEGSFGARKRSSYYRENQFVAFSCSKKVSFFAFREAGWSKNPVRARFRPRAIPHTRPRPRVLLELHNPSNGWGFAIHEM